MVRRGRRFESTDVTARLTRSLTHGRRAIAGEGGDRLSPFDAPPVVWQTREQTRAFDGCDVQTR